MVTAEQAMVIAAKYLTDNPVGHPDYEWIVNGWSERSDRHPIRVLHISPWGTEFPIRNRHGISR